MQSRYDHYITVAFVTLTACLPTPIVNATPISNQSNNAPMQRLVVLRGPSEFLELFTNCINGADEKIEGGIRSVGRTPPDSPAGSVSPQKDPSHHVVFEDEEDKSKSRSEAKSAVERALDKVAEANDMQEQRQRVEVFDGPDAGD